MKSNHLIRAISLLALLISFLPVSNAGALAASAPPPADMFQLPWEQGKAWVAIDGLDNGSRRPASSSHNYKLGGAIDFAPHNNMVTGENTSNFWVTAAADGTVIETSNCYLTIAHANGWLTQYQFLGNIQVHLGDVVARNQRLAVIADGVRQKYCPGYQEINVPHLHFIMRPSIVGATLAGWEVKYSSFFNRTTFSKGLITLGLFKPLLNVIDVPATPTPIVTQTATPTSGTPSMTPSPTLVGTATPTLVGPYVSTVVDSQTIQIDESALVTVSLHNVPAEGYASAEFTCSFDASIAEASNITVGDLFGADPVVAINGPQGGSFIVAVAGSNGSKATTSGAVFTFSIKGLDVGQTNLGCEARVSGGDNVLAQIPSANTSLTVLNSDSTPTPVLPTVLPSACDRAEFIADVNVPPGTVMLPGQTFTKTWRLKNLGPCTWTIAYSLVYYSGDVMGAPYSAGLTQSVGVGETVDISINMTAPNAPGSYRGYWMFRNASGQNFGLGPEATQPWFVDINVSGPTLPASLTPTQVPPSSTPTPTDVPGGPINSPTPGTTPVPGDWLTFTNLTYGFEFKYPPQGQIEADGTDNHTRIDLPFVQGTNLREKYLEVTVAENANPCRSPLASSSILQTSETVIINGISFLKETGADAGVGHLHQWIAYSTSRDNVCVSLDFILHSLNPGNFATPPPVFDYAAESAVFGQIVSTYAWLTLGPTPTPTLSTPIETPTPDGSSTATSTGTPIPSTTPTEMPGGMLNGQVLASKPVTINVYDANNVLVGAATAEADGTFVLNSVSGTHTVIASASGFLSAQASVTITNGNTTTLPTISLLAGDIDNNNVIDQFDAMTIGMSYNTVVPAAADLNNDGTINVLDLELLAANYRKTGPVVWE